MGARVHVPSLLRQKEQHSQSFDGVLGAWAMKLPEHAVGRDVEKELSIYIGQKPQVFLR